jgi:hypothetical protein
MEIASDLRNLRGPGLGVKEKKELLRKAKL